jgi:hypothetical protein
MKPKLLLRLASVIMALHTIGHTLGALNWKRAADPRKLEVINQMINNKFPSMGVMRSVGEYFDGYGFACILALLLFTAILWIVSDITPQNVILVRKILGITSVVLLAWGIVEIIFFFPFAAAFSLVASLLGFVSLFLISRERVQG